MAQRREAGPNDLPVLDGATTRSCGQYAIATVLQALTGKTTSPESVSYLSHSSLKHVLDYGLGKYPFSHLPSPFSHSSTNHKDSPKHATLFGR